VKVNANSGGKLNGIPVGDKSCSPSHRNRVHLQTGMPVRNHNGIVFGFTAESRSPSTGFPNFHQLSPSLCEIDQFLCADCRIIRNHEGQEAYSQKSECCPLPYLWRGAGREVRT